MIRFGGSFIVLALIYEAYLRYTESIGDLDLVTYYISRGTFEFAKFIGVADCEWSCFYDGCRVGREGRMINIIEGCNGLMLAITYSAYIIGIGGFTRNSMIQSIFGFIVITLFNIGRLGLLILLRDHGGDVYFYFLKYFFSLILYFSIVVLWMSKPKIDKFLSLKTEG